MSLEPKPIPESIPVTPEDHVAMLLITGTRFAHYAALFAPVAADTQQRLEVAPPLMAFITGRAVEVARETGWAVSKIQLDIEVNDWVANPVLEMALPGYAAFVPTFLAIITRWGFETATAPLEDGRENTVYFLRRLDPARLPLTVTYSELAIMERAIRVLNHTTRGVSVVSRPTEYILTPQGTFRREKRTADRVQVDTELLTMRIDGKEVELGENENLAAVVLWADAIVKGDRAPVNFTEVQKAHADRLRGKNTTYVKQAIPRDFMTLLIDYGHKGLGLR
jgi:hypothetical protein